LDDEVQIDVFLKGNFPSSFRKLANSTKEFLGLLKDRNSSRIHYRFISPLSETPDGKFWSDSLNKMGVLSIDLTVQKKESQTRNIIFPVALLTYKGKQAIVNLTPGASREISQPELNTAEALMEYQFLSALDKLIRERPPGIIYATGNGEPTDHRVMDLEQTLVSDYRFGPYDISSNPIPAEADVLLIVKPTLQFTEEEKLKIDQYVMRGGKLLCFIDNLIAEQDSLSMKPETIAFDRNLNLTDLFFRYGLRINTDLVMDLQCDYIPFVVGGTMDDPQMELLPWNYYPILSSGKSRITKSLGYVSSRFANSIDSIDVAGVRKEALLVTSNRSRTISTPALISLNENRDAPEDENFKKDAIPVAMLLEGKFTSLYKNRSTQAQRDSLAAQGFSFLNESVNNKMIIVSDGDILFNDLVPSNGPGSQPELLPMGWNKYTYTEYLKQSPYGRLFRPVANREFLLNCVEYLVSNPAISQTRNKDIVLRLLDSPKVDKQKTFWQFINIGLPILAILLFALIYQQIRKRKYAS
jgi:ABC-2 type transport system permease protein